MTAQDLDGDLKLPDTITSILEHEKKKPEDIGLARNKERTRLLKLQILVHKSRTANKHSDENDDDDDLEIVEDTSPKVERYLKRSTAMTRTKKNMLSLAKVSVNRRHTIHAVTVPSDDEDELMKAAARPLFGGKSRLSVASAMDHYELQKVLRHKTEKQNRELTKAKEDEWVRRGGKLKSASNTGPSQEADVSLNVAQLARNLFERRSEKCNTDAQDDDDMQADDEDGSDGDYRPECRDLASPHDSVDEVGGSDAVCDAETTREQVAGTDGEDEHPLPERRGRRTIRAILDDSDDENMPPNRVEVPETSMIVFDEDQENVRLQALAHRGSRSSLEEATPDEDDKENDTRFMFDRGEDKENVVVPRHVPLDQTTRPSLGHHRGSGIFDLTEGVRGRLSMSPSANIDEDSMPIRKPLQEKSTDSSDDPFAWPSTATIVHSSPMMRKGSSSLGLQSAITLGKQPSGFSDIFDDSEGDTFPISFRERPRRGTLLPASKIDRDLEPKPLAFGAMDDLFSQEEVLLSFSLHKKWL